MQDADHWLSGEDKTAVNSGPHDLQTLMPGLTSRYLPQIQIADNRRTAHVDYSLKGFVSVVQHEDESNRVVIRSRLKIDIQGFKEMFESMGLKTSDIAVTAKADYKYRFVRPCGLDHRHNEAHAGREIYELQRRRL